MISKADICWYISSSSKTLHFPFSFHTSTLGDNTCYTQLAPQEIPQHSRPPTEHKHSRTLNLIGTVGKGPFFTQTFRTVPKMDGFLYLPYKAILGVGKLPYISRIHTAYIGFCTSILGTSNVWWIFHVRKVLPSWELTYPLARHCWAWFSFSPGGILLMEEIPNNHRLDV